MTTCLVQMSQFQISKMKLIRNLRV